MKIPVESTVSLEPVLLAETEAVLDPGESLSVFVAECVRGCVAQRSDRDAFLARAEAAVERSERENSGISPEQTLQRMDERLVAVSRLLATGLSRST